MLAFVGEPPEGCYSVDHINRDPSNNFLENLRYATTQAQRSNQGERATPRISQRVEGICDTGVVVYETILAAVKAVNGKTGSFWSAMRRGGPYKGYRWRYIIEDNGDVWKDIPSSLVGGQTGYAASDGGLIRFPNGRTTSGSPLNGYLRVSINRRGFYVHRLVAGSYLPPVAVEQANVNHRDGNRSNNRLENLEYVTQAENIQHAHRVGLVASQGRRLRQYTIQGDFVREFRNAYEAGRTLGKGYSAFHMCCRGDIKTAYGFVWRYAEQV